MFFHQGLRSTMALATDRETNGALRSDLKNVEGTSKPYADLLRVREQGMQGTVTWIAEQLWLKCNAEAPVGPGKG